MPPTLKSGRAEHMAYSLSRWTDLVATKWDWFRERLAQGQMLGVDPRTGFPTLWDITPEETLGLIFWTREPSNLIRDAHLLRDYKKVVHFTLTGWHEVEHKAPGIDYGLELMAQACDKFGAENVIWRFSPVPYVDDAVHRFDRISSRVARMGIRDCYISFLQTNDLMAEERPVLRRNSMLRSFAAVAPELNLYLCNEDSTIREALAHPDFRGAHSQAKIPNLSYGICEDSKRFAPDVKTEGCGCALSVDPFTVNETCRFGCAYCYAADKSISPKKKNTTKAHRLPVVGG
jgi:DNA repair photolyase